MNKRQELREWVNTNIELEEKNEKVSDEDIKKIKQVGHNTAKDVHGDKYDYERAENMINNIIEKGIAKGMGDDDISQWVMNSFRDEE